MAYSVYGGVDMLLMFYCQEYKSRRGWPAVFHASALLIVSQCDVIITLTPFILMPSLRFGLFCNKSIK